jgi:hypothetical protein
MMRGSIKQWQTTISALLSISALAASGAVHAQTSPTDLKNAAKALPSMPQEVAQLGQQLGITPTFASGTPYNDIEYTLFDTDSNEGETNGFDIFMPVDPSQSNPGSNTIKLLRAVNNLDLEDTYNGQVGDRIILGTAGIVKPFFSKGSDGVDNDYALITNFDYNNGSIQLKGASTDYGLVRCTTADGCDTDGFYLFHIATGSPDLIAFIFPCDDISLPISGTQPANPNLLCNSNKTLSLTNTAQFSYATAIGTTPSLTSARQFGTSGNEIVGGVTVDSSGATYVMGASDGSLDGGAYQGNEIFVRKYNADKTLAWTREVTTTNGSLLFDGVTDGTYIYVAGRTLGALSGFTNRGKWDAILLKLRLSDGVVVATNQWGNEGLDGYGNITLDDAGNLYLSGAGSPAGSADTDDAYLVAKHRTSDLGNVWRKIVAPTVTSGQVIISEAWGGISYIKSATAGAGKVVVGGWLMSASGSNGFLEVWQSVNTTSPTKAASTTISSPNGQADWVLDNTVDSAGNIYAVGYTSGDLNGTHKGNGDAYIVKYNSNLGNPTFKQVGTAQSDQFRKVEIDNSGNLYAVGYTYGNYSGNNKDSTRKTGDVFVQKFTSTLGVSTAYQFGTPWEDRAYMQIRGSTLHLGGMTEGALGSSSLGAFDAFFLRLATSNLAPQ